MARIRTIKPEFWTSEQILECSTNARLLFIGLWNFADDQGRHPDSAKQAKAEVFPADDFSIAEVAAMLDELWRNGLIDRYTHDNKGYFFVTGWNHQRIDKPQEPKYPGPFEEYSENIPRTLPPDRKGKDRKGKEGKGKDRLRSSNAVELALDRSVPEVKVGTFQSNAEITKVFDHWKQIHNHPRAKLDAKRSKVIREALKTYSEADLCQSISGYLNSPHHMGDNPKRTVYDDIELLLRDAKHIDAGIRFYEKPPSSLSENTARNIDRTSNWVPQELRNAS